jgi:hypothetical protein
MKIGEKLFCADSVGCEVTCEEGLRFIVGRRVGDLDGFALGVDVILGMTDAALVGSAEEKTVTVGLAVRALLGLAVAVNVGATEGVLVGVAVGVVGSLVGETVGPDGASVGRAVGLEGAAEGVTVLI